MLGGAIGHIIGAQIGFSSIAFEQIGATCPLIQEHWQSANT
jgi:hypothetical protein